MIKWPDVSIRRSLGFVSVRSQNRRHASFITSIYRKPLTLKGS